VSDSDPALAERADLRDGYAMRAWVYSVGLVGIALGVTVAALRSAPRARRGELFTDLGVAGVVAGLVAWGISASEPNLIGDASGEGAIWLPAAAMLLVAGTGSVAVRALRARTGAATTRPRRGSGRCPRLRSSQSACRP
jgi:hypothetical protein